MSLRRLHTKVIDKNLKIYLGIFVILFASMFGFVTYVVVNSNSYSFIEAQKTDLDEGSITIYFESKGNNIYYVEQEVSTYINSDDNKSLKKLAETTKKNYSKYSGITYSYEITENEYIEKFKVDMDKVNNESLKILGLTSKDNVDVKLQLDKTIKLLEKEGFVISEKRK